ncbi:MAG: hypothetical protein AAFV07_21670, partial [Bacteroidota bacterium]
LAFTWHFSLTEISVEQNVYLLKAQKSQATDRLRTYGTQAFVRKLVEPQVSSVLDLDGASF